MRTLDWMSLNDHVCHLEIDDGSNTTTAMTAGERPFVTQMDESDEIFKNIRTCTGNIGVKVDSVDDIVDLVGRTPISTPVTLTVDNVVRWVGFLSCESFSQEWDRGPLDISLPVMSGLEVLNGIRYPYTQLSVLGYISFAQFLLNVNTALGGIYTNFYFPKVSNTTTTLTYIFRMSNYATPDDKNTTYEMATYYDILDDICKLFGWQAIEYEQSLVFMCADIKLTSNNSIMDGYTVEQLTSLAGGTAVTPSEPTFSTVIPEFYGVDHRRSFVAGKNKVEVTGELNEIDQSIWKMDVFSQCKFNGNNYHAETTVGNRLERYTVKKMACIDGGNIEVYNNVFSGGDVSPDTEGNNIKYAKAYLGATNAYGASITYEQFAKYQNTLPYKTIIGGSLDFFQRLILKAYSSILILNAKISTNFWYEPTQNQQYNAFRISADVKYATDAVNAFESSWSGQKYLEVSLVIQNGNTEYYYDRSNNRWTTDGGKFNIYCSDGKIDEASYNSIPVPANITGEVIMYIWSSTDGIGDGFIALENLSIQLYTKEGRVKGKQSPRVELDELRENENVEKVDLGNGFSDSWSQTCGLTLARENVPDSNGVVLKNDRTYPTSLYSNKYPEKALCDRVATYAAQARMMLSAVVKADGAMLSPFVNYVMKRGGRPWVLLSQTIDWNNEECVAEFFEPSYNS